MFSPPAGWLRIRCGGFCGFCRDHMNADRAAPPQQIVHHRTVQYLEPSRSVRIADDDLGNVVRFGIGHDLFRDPAARYRDGRSPEPFREPQMLGDAIPLGVARSVRARRLDMDRGPRRVESVGGSPRIADQPRHIRRSADANQEVFAMGAHMRQPLLVYALRGPADAAAIVTAFSSARRRKQRHTPGQD